MHTANIIYFDNAATTMMPPSVLRALVNWCNRGNPSAGYKSAAGAREMMAAFRARIGELCGVSVDAIDRAHTGSARPYDPQKYKVIITSGASEANCMIVRAAVDAYALASSVAAQRGATAPVIKPHIVMSAIEHKSLMALAEDLTARGLAEVTYVQPAVTGHILAADVQRAIAPTTCIICVMHANNETGAINDIAAIGTLAREADIPLHCDIVQSFGKYALGASARGASTTAQHADSLAISFHKVHGPPGVGVALVRNSFLHGYNLAPAIYGTQNGGLRGGTENLPGIGAAYAALALIDPAAHMRGVHPIRMYIMRELAAAFPCYSYAEYTRMRAAAAANTCPLPHCAIVFISGVGGSAGNSANADASYIPGILLLSVVKPSPPLICNTKIKQELEKRGIVVSIGSACNTASAKASHVLYALGADQYIRAGALRISVGDQNTLDEAAAFVRAFCSILGSLHGHGHARSQTRSQASTQAGKK